jgi:acetyl-CoA synthetase
MSENIIWKPSKSVIKNANITKFMDRHEIKTYEELIQRSTTGIEWFWDSCVHETDISWFEPYTRLADLSEGFEFTKWFLGGRLNITHNCIDRHLENKKIANKVAVMWQGECGAVKKMTYTELYHETNQVANYLKSQGVGKEDYVALYMPMLPELIPVFFAILKIGAVVVPIFSGFGPDAVVSRCQNAGVKIIITADGTLRRGKQVLLKSMLEDCLNAITTLEKCIVINRLGLANVPMTPGRDVFYNDVIPQQQTIAETEELLSEHQSIVMYTSGTTGEPKGTVHTHAGVLAQVTKELYFNFDLQPKDVFYWVTDIGWMMGPWEMIGTLHFGATLVIAEGMPMHPKADRFLKICDDFNVTHLGVSPTLIRLFMHEGAQLVKNHSLKTLRILGSTGEPWDPDSYMWFFENVGKGKLPIVNISGGTELMGCLLAPLIIKELKPCSLQSPGLGMAVDVFTEGGYSVDPGEVGFLVCKKPAPSMTKGFLHDKQRYLDTYFSKFRHVWNHGDWVVRDADGHWYMRGRADDTIKIAGKRTGPAEIESSLCLHPFISEACAIGVPDDIKGEVLVCLVVLKKGIGETAFIKSDLKNWVMHHLGKTLKPQAVHIVSVLPKTRSGKIVRGVIKKKYLGQDLGDMTNLENPHLLKELPSM